MAPKELLLVHQRYGYESVILGTEGYTTVQTVFRVVSNLTAFASVGFKFVSYMGFSNEACPLLFSCPAYPLYCTFGLVLGKKKIGNYHSNISTLSTYNSKCPQYLALLVVVTFRQVSAIPLTPGRSPTACLSTFINTSTDKHY